MSNEQAPLPFPDRADDAHKGDFGRVLLVGGSRGMSGSIALSSIAALKTGSGLVSAAVPDRCLDVVAGFHPGIMTIPLEDTDEGCFGLAARLPDLRSFDAIACGPGMRTIPGSIRLVESLLMNNFVARVMDADAINILAENELLDSPALPRDQSGLILTPHPGELARLTGIPPGDREGQIKAATALAQRFAMTIVVKGGPTVVVGVPSSDTLSSSDKLSTGDGNTSIERFVNGSGNPGMATAGSGDVLTGVIASLAGQGFSPWDAARLGVYLHGLAGDLAAKKYTQQGMTCLELLELLPAAIGSL